MQNIIKMTLDTKKQGYYTNSVNQNDDLILELNIVEYGMPITLTGETVQLNYLNANKTITSVAGSLIVVSSNKVTITCPTDCTRSAGFAYFQLIISKNGLQTSTFEVEIKVEQSIIEGQVASANVATLTEDLINANNDGLATIEILETDIANGNTDVIRSDLNSAKTSLAEMTSFLNYMPINGGSFEDFDGMNNLNVLIDGGVY